MGEHTPGPWEAGREEQELKGDPDDPWVVYGWSLMVSIASSNPEADARLIAAAPSLLAVAEVVLSYFEDSRPVDLFQHGGFNRDLRAAIAKATEETKP